MSRSTITMRATTRREKILARACDVSQLNSESEVIDAALQHYVQSVDAYRDVKDDVTPEMARRLSTDIVRINHYPQVKYE